jgi:single-strand DNA-binding protein
MNVRFSVATNRRWRDQSGQQQEKTTWFRVTCWGKLAESVDGLSQNGYLSKGRQVYVEGRIELNTWQDQQGQTRADLDVNATEFQLLGSRGDAEGGQGGGQFGGGPRGGGQRGGGDQTEEPASFDDVPF